MYIRIYIVHSIQKEKKKMSQVQYKTEEITYTYS